MGPFFPLGTRLILLIRFYAGLSSITGISLGFQAYYSLALVWPYFYVISEPSGTYRGTPSPFLELQLALKLEPPEALVSLYSPVSLIPVPARVRSAPLGAGRGLLAVTKLGQIGPW